MRIRGLFYIMVATVVAVAQATVSVHCAVAADYVNNLATFMDTAVTISHTVCGGPALGETAWRPSLTVTPVHGTLSDAGSVVLSTAEELGRCGTSTGGQETRILIYTPDTGYVGADMYRFYHDFPSPATDTGYITITPIGVAGIPFESGAAVSVTQNLQTSVQLLTGLIHGRISGIFKKASADVGDSALGSAPGQTVVIYTPTMPGFADEASVLLLPEHNLLGDFLNVKCTGKEVGLSAGGSVDKHGVWFNLGITATDDDNLLRDSDSILSSYVLGYDYMVNERMALGVAVAYEDMAMNTDFNNGSLDSAGYTISPYFVWLVAEHFSTDLIIGYSYLKYDQDRDYGAIRSSLNASRQFVQINGTFFHSIDNWNVSGSVSYLYAHEVQDSFSESNGHRVRSYSANFAQCSAGLEIAYSFQRVEPYLTLSFERDTQYVELGDAGFDETGGEGGFGLRINFMDSLSGELSCSAKFGREGYGEYTFLGNLRYTF